MASRRLFAVFLLFALLFLGSFQLSAFSSTVVPEKVRLELFYETLCPYCSRFIVSSLSKIFEDGLISIIDLNLVPYGNARIDANSTITCQHGPYECLLNTVEACAISAWPDAKVYFGLIYCVEQLVAEHRYIEWETCFQKSGVESKLVLDCYSNGHGKELELQYSVETNALQPPHRFVPWVIVNGKPLFDVGIFFLLDYEKFEVEVCKAYKGDPPKACAGLLLMGAHAQLLKSSRAVPACYANDVTTTECVSSCRR